MFNAIAHALLALAPEFDAAKVEDVPVSLKAGSMVRKATSGGRLVATVLVRHFFAN